MSMRLTVTVLAVLALASCGAEEQPPVEQIVVREPGQPAAQPGAEAAAGSSDLVAAGKAAFASCAACHSVDPTGASGIGPNLHGALGRKAAAVEGFAYSDALANSGLTWTEGELDAFLAGPATKVPGTSMAAGAVSDAATRTAIIAYLATLTG
ncbi:c-type cytochrome [Erythrobacter sp. SDW2]|uniref:c-type cytochrome n=1 Tax=Erythrobacter sp. SDW2 TaxID=2907154 RepID=UPI001F1FAD14|nr:c-type cytochrome [Erythrobacter sp. SDW2]UIP07646.1 c-type cytochrome [Erythrobacter sp. SDW2]